MVQTTTTIITRNAEEKTGLILQTYLSAFLTLGFLCGALCSGIYRYLNLVFFARLSFASCCICMIFSIFLFLQEIRLSNEALKFHLSDMDSMKKDY